MTSGAADAARAPARLGLLLPSSNTVMEPDLQGAFAGRATVHTARMHLADPVTRAGELAMLDRHAEPAARDLATLAPDLAILGCTSAGSLRGHAADVALRERLGALVGAPVLGILDALSDALHARGARRVSLLTPYVPALTRPIADDLATAGFTVLRATGMGVADNLAVGRLTPDDVIAAARDALAPGSDALAIACTNLRALEAQPSLERALGLPVVTATSAVLELALARLRPEIHAIPTPAWLRESLPGDDLPENPCNLTS